MNDGAALANWRSEAPTCSGVLAQSESVPPLMIILLLVVHILVAISLVGVILLQKSEGGALGMGGGGMSGFHDRPLDGESADPDDGDSRRRVHADEHLAGLVQQSRTRAALDHRPGAPAAPAADSDSRGRPRPHRAHPPRRRSRGSERAGGPAADRPAPAAPKPAAPAEPQPPSPPLAR